MNLRPFLAGTLVFLALFGTAAAEGSTDVLLKALADCAAVTDGQARLACYDKLAPQVKDALANPARQTVASSHPPTEEEQKSWFGFDIGSLFGTSPEKQTTPEQFGSERTEAKQQEVTAKEIDSIAAGVTEYAYNPFGKFIVFLDNGQIWKQLQGDSDRARFRHTAADNKVTISRGLMGSYNLKINDSDTIYKVTRVK